MIRLSPIFLFSLLALACPEPDPARDALRHPTPDAVLVQQVGTVVAALDFYDVDGTTHSLASFRGRTVVLDFWSPRCPVCRRAEPARRRFAGGLDPERVAYCLVVSNRDEYPDEIKESLAGGASSGTVILDSRQRFARRFNVTRTPCAVLIDPEGIVRFMGAPLSPEQLAQAEPPRADWLEDAFEALRLGRPPDPPTRPVTGTPIRMISY